MEYKVYIHADVYVKKNNQTDSIWARRTITLPFAPTEGTILNIHADSVFGNYWKLTSVAWDMTHNQFRAKLETTEDWDQIDEEIPPEEADTLEGYMAYTLKQLIKEGWIVAGDV